VKKFEDLFYVLMVTEQGLVKKTPLGEFSSPRRTGIAAIGLGKGDRLMDVRLTDGNQDIVLGTRQGLAIRFHEGEVRPMGRGASGVRAIRLGKDDKVVGSVSLRRSGTTVLVATEKGFGKRSETAEYRVTRRGGKGIITVKTTEKTGKMVAIKEVVETDDVVIITAGGIVIRQHASEIRLAGRNTQGVRLIRLDEHDAISDVAAVVSEEDDNADGSESAKRAGAQADLFTGDVGKKEAGPRQEKESGKAQEQMPDASKTTKDSGVKASVKRAGPVGEGGAEQESRSTREGATREAKESRTGGDENRKAGKTTKGPVPKKGKAKPAPPRNQKKK
jgi:DNA gyrase subunit A